MEVNSHGAGQQWNAGGHTVDPTLGRSSSHGAHDGGATRQVLHRGPCPWGRRHSSHGRGREDSTWNSSHGGHGRGHSEQACSHGRSRATGERRDSRTMAHEGPRTRRHRRPVRDGPRVIANHGRWGKNGVTEWGTTCQSGVGCKICGGRLGERCRRVLS